MNKKNMKKSLKWKLNDWVKSIKDPKVRIIVEENAIVTGGAFVSLLNGEHPNDYDIYFKTKESLLEVVKYYIGEWHKRHTDATVELNPLDDRVMLRIKSQGIVEEGKEVDPSELLLPYQEEGEDETEVALKIKEKYRPVFLSTNAITLADKIQIVIRFYGSIEEIHKNYDYTHTTCSYDFAKDEIILPSEALECIINKELRYQGSKYPLASIIRSRKFIQRGWTINAGQYLKMALQLNELDLKDPEVLEDQLVGVDSYYFNKFIEALKHKKEEDPNFSVDNTYLFSVINRIF